MTIWLQTAPKGHLLDSMTRTDIDQFWAECLQYFANTLPPQQFKTWVKPLTAHVASDTVLCLTAPNRFVLSWVKKNVLDTLQEMVDVTFSSPNLEIQLRVTPSPQVLEPDDKAATEPAPPPHEKNTLPTTPQAEEHPSPKPSPAAITQASSSSHTYTLTRLSPMLTFDTLVTGKANQLAYAAAQQVSHSPGKSYNPLFVYGGVGLGKTHLIHAIGNHLFKSRSHRTIRYIHANDYYADVVKSYQQDSFDSFTQYYRSLDLLLIDDIQFFNNKTRTQEEFFHAFNALIEAKRQIIITCDTYPKDITGLGDRLISRFDWGLTVAIEPPELEMRVAILQKKANQENLALDDAICLFMARHLKSNVRELEGALNKVIAYANFHGQEISLSLVKEALKDLLNAFNRQITVDLIQKTVSDFYKVKVSDLHSKKRTSAISRPRQVAMALSRELTPASLPAIGEAFGGRDHTTVLHACRNINNLRKKDPQINHDFHILLQLLKG